MEIIELAKEKHDAYPRFQGNKKAEKQYDSEKQNQRNKSRLKSDQRPNFTREMEYDL